MKRDDVNTETTKTIRSILDLHYTIDAVANYLRKGLRFVAVAPNGQVWGADTTDSQALAEIAADVGCAVIDLKDVAR